LTSPKIEPHRITRPIQLLAVWIAGLILLVSAFLTAAGNISNPPWLPGLFGISAVALVPVFVALIFIMQTKFRQQMQDDSYYAEWLKRNEASFRNFKPENIVTGTAEIPPGSPEAALDSEDLEKRRIARYEKNLGLFLIHTWRPSRTKGQVADVIIQLHQHRDDGPLTRGDVEKVEYSLGPKFFSGPVMKTNRSENFRLEISAYGPVLCVGRAYVRGHSKPIDLERYIYFQNAT
jgi:hypothetical protein